MSQSPLLNRLGLENPGSLGGGPSKRFYRENLVNALTSKGLR
jgi:hypothetical protein